MRRLLLLALVVLACKKDESKPRPNASPQRMSADPCAKAHAEGSLAWIADDYPSALACAKQRGVPLVLDMWAPWCHTCLSMQSTVFMDPSFAADASKFVFAAIDTDREVNAVPVEKFPNAAWPTFFVVDPADEKVLARFVGAASVAQFHAFLDTGARAIKGGAVGPDEHLLAAERAVAAKDLATAEAELAAALAAAPADWPRKADALVSLISTKNKRKDVAGCLDIAEKQMNETGNTASASDFLFIATECASAFVKDSKDAAAIERVEQLRQNAVIRWQVLIDDKAAPLSVDDRSDAMANLRETLIALDRKAEAKKIALAQLAMLDDAAAKAPNPMAAMTYNWPRAEVYVFLERPLDLVPALEKSAADLPKEYDPLARLGWIYLKAGKLDDAARWLDKAIALVYGPRKIRVLTYRAEVEQKRGDKAGEKKWREEIVKTLEALPAGQTTPEAIARAKQAVLDVDKPAEPAGSAKPK